MIGSFKCIWVWEGQNRHVPHDSCSARVYSGLQGTDTGDRGKLGRRLLNRSNKEWQKTWIRLKEIELERKRQIREIVNTSKGLGYWFACRGRQKQITKFEVSSLCDRYHWECRLEWLLVISVLVESAAISHHENDWFVWMCKLGLSVNQNGD